MSLVLDFIYGYFWVCLIIVAVLLPFAVLLARKLAHLFKLLGVYPHPRRRPPWSRCDLSQSEIYTHLEQLAKSHQARRPFRNGSIDRLHWQIYMGLQTLRRRLSSAPAGIISLVPASQWFFDNYNLFYKELSKLQSFGNLHKFRTMPTLTAPEENGYPRVYRLAREIVSCSDYHLNEKVILEMLVAYQQVCPLLARELWALPEMLVLCLIEKIVDESRHVIEVIRIKRLADKIADRVAAKIGPDIGGIAAQLRKESGAACLKDRSFVSHLYLRMRSMSVSDAEITEWLATALNTAQSAYALEFRELLEEEAAFEADSEAIIRSLVISLKVIVDVNWDEELQQASTLEILLARDPAGIYAKMNGSTRSLYRITVEKLARRFKLSETAVAEKVLGWAQTPPDDLILSEPGHIGSYLTGKGLDWTTAQLAGRVYRHKKTKHVSKPGHALVFYAGIALLTAVIITGGILIVLPTAPSVLLIIILGLTLLILGSSISIRLLQDISAKLYQPLPQLSMDYQMIIPDKDRTLVVMPVIMGSAKQVQAYIDRLEKHYLANQQNNLAFALLGDFIDADTQITADDACMTETAINAIHLLNTRYPEISTRFFFLYRPRLWNASENCWMGWERKRGKLEELNALLMGEQDTGYIFSNGDRLLLQGFKYVITIDADTELIRESAARLVGIMAHPLNRPLIDEKTQRIVDGYAIVQPEIRSRMPGPTASVFSRFFSGQTGIDPYATVVSDIYQDVFNEGTFVGKGIYDVEVMHRLLRGNIPENSVLSHDLLEGSLSRVAFASGVKFMDTQPSGIISYIRREHRWIRGDWQLLPWLKRPTMISGLSRWKIIDNIRRSLVQPASLALVLLCALALPTLPWLWLPIICFDSVYSILMIMVRIIIQKNRNPSMRLAIKAFMDQLVSRLLMLLIEIMLIPSRGLLALDAIFRTVYRLTISHRKLLEWQTSESVDSSVLKTIKFHFAVMWPAIIPAVPVLVGAMLQTTPGWMCLLTLIALFWFLSPLLSYLASRQAKRSPPSPAKREQIRRLRLLARRTWNFFEDFSTPETHWLCPDNYQKYPGPKVSDKTSPTNIGLQLLSTLAARDMGFIGLHTMIDTCEKVISIVEKLPKWHGHLYNWYQVNPLRVLDPQYVSTVDSGNFVGHLVALKQGLLGVLRQPVFSGGCVTGLNDTLVTAGLADYKLNLKVINMNDWGESLNKLTASLETAPTDQHWKKRIALLCAGLQTDLDLQGRSGLCKEQNCLQDMAAEGNEKAIALIVRINGLVSSINDLVNKADFRELYDHKHQLFMIGFHVDSQTPDSGRYDLMASEARLSSFLAIAKGDVPQKHWFALGRPFTLIRGTPTLLSWSGSMFEYLMPNLVLKTPPGSIFYQSSHAAVARQITQGRKMKLPWGVSESQYYAFDVNSNYQYTAFGVMRLRLQSTIRPAQVIAPYATLLALMVKPQRALNNIDRLRKIGAESEYGFYEALDYSRPDSANLRPFSLVQTSMVHHLGMSLVAMDNYLNQNIMQTRFHREPMVQAAEIMLEETIAVGLVSVSRRWYTININVNDTVEEVSESRYILAADPPEPVAHVLANRQYMVMLTSDGEGFSCCDNIFINRWRADPLGSGSGTFIYLRDLASDILWSSAYRPTRKEPDEYQVVFSLDKAEYKRRDGRFNTRTEVTLSPQENLELRRVTVTNNSDKAANIELTSYLEIVADEYRAEAAHPAFSKLFIETEFVDDRQMLIGKRRTRSPGDRHNFVMHRIIAESPVKQEIQFEIDRRLFVGRNGNLIRPQIMESSLSLSSREGFSSDPIMSLRAVVNIQAGHSATLVFLTGYAQSREEIMQLSMSYDKFHDSDDIFKLSMTSGNLRMKYLSVKPAQLNAILRLVSPIYYANLNYRGPAESIQRNQLSQSGLWRFGISGDNPIMLLRVNDLKSTSLISDVLQAFEVLRIYHVPIDLVIFNDELSGYAMELAQLIQNLTSRLRIFSGNAIGTGLFVVNRFQVTQEETDLLLSVAKVVITPETGIRFRAIKAGGTRPETRTDGPAEPAPSAVIRLTSGSHESHIQPVQSFPDKEQPLEFFNGLGGFAKGGREYVIRLRSGMKPPSPWINVIANDVFGFLVSETGGGYTWAGNSRENKLTTWSNDPVLDPISEAIYIRDEATGAITSPCLLNAGFGGHYQVRHGFGYTTFEHDELALRQSMTVFVTEKAPVKLWLLTIANEGAAIRNFSITLYVEWLLGVQRELSAPFVVTSFDHINDSLMAVNAYNEQYRDKKTFIFSSEKITSCTGSRKEFLGTSISARYPQGLSLPGFSGAVGAGLDPCGVIQVCVSLAPGESRSIVFGMGQTANIDEAASLMDQLRVPANAAEELNAARDYWDRKLGGVTLRSPDRTLDILMNGWLRYQVLSCRIKARSAFYQCGGAFGFRDQLQDVLSFMDNDPGLVRQQILLCCSRQFIDGDVQHWWHPPTGVGVRTRISDDLLWLPYVVAEYLRQTGDYTLLTENAPWLTGDRLQEDQHEIMFIPQVANKTDTVYKHCLQAIERAAHFGSNGLPLMGSGDWNDGMNLVGVAGHGESVWLGWFMYAVLHRFIAVCQQQGDVANSRRMASMAANLTGNLDSAAWDGQWYLRAFFDNGNPMGSSKNDECQIDSISQSWAVLSGAANPRHAARAIESARQHLVKDEYHAILLLEPPFDKSQDNPGYIRGYFPGVRENGGQYTHAAIWLAMATAQLKQTSEAWRLLNILNPIWSTIDLRSAYRYEKEPYVMSADISMAAPFEGRAGWSWYTGSASWMYQAVLQSFLGIRREGEQIVIDPCVPESWRSFHVEYCVGAAKYQLDFRNKSGPGTFVQSITVDDVPADGNRFNIIDDGKIHYVAIVLTDKKNQH